jgi:DNA (cytosine-5)-methyltransferase 1
MKILNLFAGIGGNRKLWGDKHEVTAVEMDPIIAKVYADLYPKDKLIIGDAHQYLLDHYNEFDFIWTSPPCQTHSSMRQNLAVRYRSTKPVYPDMMLYQQIIFLQYNYTGKYLVENVNPYYTPLIPPVMKLDRHLVWTNIKIEPKEFIREKLRSAQIPDLERSLGYDLSAYKIPNKRQVLRNCVLPDMGEYILNSVLEELVNEMD